MAVAAVKEYVGEPKDVARTSSTVPNSPTSAGSTT
jgi:hypothetical protein